MELARAQAMATAIIARLSPYCRPERIKAVGSIRRKKDLVNDIDLVMVPSDPWKLYVELKSMGEMKADGDKAKRLIVNGAQVDVYFATEETWATVLLIRTGSKESNIRLATRAKKMGLQLKANGEGLIDQDGRRLAGNTEQSIFEALGIPYLPPERR